MRVILSGAYAQSKDPYSVSPVTTAEGNSTNPTMFSPMRQVTLSMMKLYSEMEGRAPSPVQGESKTRLMPGTPGSRAYFAS
jgi:hypothetical protein